MKSMTNGKAIGKDGIAKELIEALGEKGLMFSQKLQTKFTKMERLQIK